LIAVLSRHPKRSSPVGEQEFFERLADLAIRVGTNLRSGQELVVVGDVEHAPIWRYGSELDFSDGVTSVIVLGAEVNAANAAWQEWPDAGGPYPEVSVRNRAVAIGLVSRP
jgi:leucyl aminopeptidase (aminopeptidase T)